MGLFVLLRPAQPKFVIRIVSKLVLCNVLQRYLSAINSNNKLDRITSFLKNSSHEHKKNVLKNNHPLHRETRKSLLMDRWECTKHIRYLVDLIIKRFVQCTQSLQQYYDFWKWGKLKYLA